VIYDAGDVVVVPFPFTDRATTKRRPALILSDGAVGEAIGHSLLAMITSAKQSGWPLDVPIADRGAAGLDTACVVRMKLFTLDHRLIVRRAGTLGAGDRAAVSGAVKELVRGLLDFDRQD